MTRERASWRLVFLSYPCETCGAAPSNPCITTSGKVYNDVHAGRTRNGHRCPRCGTLVSFDLEPGSLCNRCALLRSLEIERATIHRRRS